MISSLPHVDRSIVQAAEEMLYYGIDSIVLAAEEMVLFLIDSIVLAAEESHINMYFCLSAS